MPTFPIQAVLDTIATLDPLVGDTSCQLHAMYLLHLYQKVKSHSLINSDIDLSEHLIQTLNAAYLLSQHDSKLDPSQISMPCRGKVLSSINLPFPDQQSASDGLIEFSTNSQRDKKVILDKIHLAQESIQFAKQFLPETTDFSLYTDTTSLTAYLPSSKKKIPLLPCFLSAYLMLRYLKQTQSLLLIDLRRMEKCDDRDNIIGADVIAYRYQAGHFVSIPLTESLVTELGIGISIVSYRYNKEACLRSRVNELFSIEDMAAFKHHFIETFDIAALIMMAAAAHPQFPASACLDLPSPFSAAEEFDLASKGADEILEKVDVFDLQQCTLSQYGFLYQQSMRYGLLEPELPSPAFAIKHIQISTPAKILAAHAAIKVDKTTTVLSRSRFFQQKPCNMKDDVTSESVLSFGASNG